MVQAEVIASIATASGTAAIGVVRLSGPRLSTLMRPLFGRAIPPRRAVLTDFLDSGGQALDTGIALFFPAPRSYTGEDVLELQGHGGPAVLQLILRRCLAMGARLASPGEFSKRAFLNGKLDLAQAESVADLIEASSEAAARAAMRSLKGEFSREILSLVSGLTTLRVQIEAGIDFPDDETGSGYNADLAESVRDLRGKLRSVQERAVSGSSLRETARIVLIGPPNVGKSSLLNQLAGDDVAIVSEVPGTTRDVVRSEILFDGMRIQLVDTAGLRETQDTLERLGIDRTQKAVQDADVLLLVNDAALERRDDEALRLAEIPMKARKIRVLNKIDLIHREPALDESAGEIEIGVSAKTGAGLPLLRSVILDAAGRMPGVEGVFLARERHLDSLTRASAHLQQAESALNQLDLAAEELRLAQLALAEITGEFTADDLLGQIFAKFCLGK